MRDVILDVLLGDAPTQHSFRIVGGPLDQPTQVDRALSAFGWLAMSWSRLELHVDLMLLQINKARYSKNIFDPDHPISFSRKLKLLKRWYKNHPELKGRKEVLVNLADDKIYKLSELRNQYIHSLFESYDQKNDTAILKSIQPLAGRRFKFASGNVPIQLLAETAIWINRINILLARVSNQVFSDKALELTGKS